MSAQPASKIIDLRSDTVTRPSAAMKAAMFNTEVGDDVYRDDPSVLKLETRAAELFGFEAGLYCCSGTQSNLIALMTHCQRGDEYIVGQQAHTYKFEAGGAAVLASIQPQPIAHQPDGSLALADIEAAIKPDDPHYARTRLLALENTWLGHVLPRDYIRDAQALARRHGLVVHLDGARICNAAVKQGISLRDAVAGFDSVSVCLSKGLGAPIGSVLLGSRQFIKQAIRNRKILGGGMRQAGFMAAAGLYALENNVARLAEDHRNAELLAEGLAAIPGLSATRPQTNIFYVDFPPASLSELREELQRHQILLALNARTRMVLHLDVSTEDVRTMLRVIGDFYAKWQPPAAQPAKDE